MFLGSLTSQSNNMFVSKKSGDSFISAYDFAGNSYSNIVTGGDDLNNNPYSGTYPICPISSNQVVNALGYGIRFDSTYRSNSIFSFAGFVYTSTSSYTFNLGTHVYPGTPRLIVRFRDGVLEGSTSISAFTPEYSTRYHIAVTYDGAIAKVYKNGSLVYNNAIGLGSYYGATDHFFGVIISGDGTTNSYADNLVLSNNVLSSDTISLLASGAMPGPDGFI